MRRVRIVLGLAAAVCAFGALAGPAFATKPKLVFGEFVASMGGKTLSESEKGTLALEKEDEPEVTGLEIGPYAFGTYESETNEINYEEPCAKLLKLTGKVSEEHSSVLHTELTFPKCSTWSESDGKGSKAFDGKASTFKLGVTFQSNRAAEIGPPVEDGFKIEQGAVTIHTAQHNCEMVIPTQFIPAKAAVKPEKEYEAATYAGEEPEEVENWEKSKKLKEEYPSGVKERLEIDMEEGFKGIVAYLNPTFPCVVESPKAKIRTEEPYKGWVEYNKGRIVATIPEIEVKGGELTFVEPPEA